MRLEMRYVQGGEWARELVEGAPPIPACRSGGSQKPRSPAGGGGALPAPQRRSGARLSAARVVRRGPGQAFDGGLDAAVAGSVGADGPEARVSRKGRVRLRLHLHTAIPSVPRCWCSSQGLALLKGWATAASHPTYAPPDAPPPPRAKLAFSKLPVPAEK